MAETKLKIWRYRSPHIRLSKFLARIFFLKIILHKELDLHVHGRENLSKLSENQKFIAVANHASHLDALLIMTELPWRLARKLATGAAADYFSKNKIKSLQSRIFVNTFPVGRGDDKKYKGISGQLLEKNVPILIMPEGSRSRTGEIGEFKPGAAALAIKHNAPILPIAIVGAFAAWPAGQKKRTVGRPEVHVVFGAPLRTKKSESVEKFNARIRQNIVEMHDNL